MARAKAIEFLLTSTDGTTQSIWPRGRDAWTLNQLIEAGSKGCTPIDNPAPRWSGYVHKLRKVYGVDIQTIEEAHGGPFAGTHARYVLRSNVVMAESESEAA
ncbi:MAG: hypothetical protein AAGF54_06070 [Pseudomonadota bacterium]